VVGCVEDRLGHIAKNGLLTGRLYPAAEIPGKLPAAAGGCALQRDTPISSVQVPPRGGDSACRI